MSGSESTARPSETLIREIQQREADDGEPLRTETRNVQQVRSSTYINISSYARDTLGISKGDEVELETHRNKIVITIGGD